MLGEVILGDAGDFQLGEQTYFFAPNSTGQSVGLPSPTVHDPCGAGELGDSGSMPRLWADPFLTLGHSIIIQIRLAVSKVSGSFNVPGFRSFYMYGPGDCTQVP